MQNKRKRILAMLENGTITTEDALTLLEKLGDGQGEKDRSDQKLKSEKPNIRIRMKKK